MRGLPYEKRRIVVPLLTLVVFIAAWELLVRTGVVPSFLLPAPSAVATAFVAEAPLLVEHTLTTVLEAALGLAIGVVVGFVFAVLMDRFETFYLAFNPLITVS